MDTFTSKYQAHISLLENDPEYMVLQASFLDAQQAFQIILSALEPSQQEIIHEYLGTLAELQMREIELALMLN